MVLSGVLSQGYSVINTIIAGKLLGDNALAAIGAISLLETFINSVFWGYGTGVGIYTAHLFGGGKYFRMKSMIISNLAFLSAVSYAVVSAFYMLKLRKSFKEVGVAGHKTKISFKVIGETCRYSVLSMLQQSVMYLAGLMLSPMVNSIGAAASASYTVTLRIYDVNAVIYQNSAKTLGNYTAQCYGAKKYGLLKKGVRVGFVQNLLFVLPVLLVCVLLPRSVSMLFYTADASPVSVQYTVDFLRYCMPFLVCNIAANLFHHFFRGIGNMTSLLITTLVGSGARLIISWFLIVPFGIYGYYAGWVLSWLLDGLTGVVIYKFGKWRKIFVNTKELS